MKSTGETRVGRVVTILAIILSAAWTLRAQNFTNLNFEATSVSAYYGAGPVDMVPISIALPGWSGSLGTNPATQVVYNTLSTGAVEIDLLGRNAGMLSNLVIAGQFTAVLQSGGGGPNGTTLEPASIAQMGLVPYGSLSLQFAAVADPADLVVTFDGQNIPIVPLNPGPSYYELQEYGADISQYAGDVGELQFSAVPNDFPFSNVYLDSIMFSTSPVPEPATCGLILCGTVLLGFKRRGKR